MYGSRGERSSCGVRHRVNLPRTGEDSTWKERGDGSSPNSETIRLHHCVVNRRVKRGPIWGVSCESLNQEGLLGE